MQELRKMRPKKQMPSTSLKQTGRMKGFTVVLLTTSSEEGEGGRARALHQGPSDPQRNDDQRQRLWRKGTAFYFHVKTRCCY